MNSIATMGFGKKNKIATGGFNTGAFIKQYFAVEHMTLVFNDSNHSGDIEITGDASSKAKKIPEEYGCYLDNLEISISNGSDGSTTMNATGIGYIKATTTKFKCEDQKPLRQTDKTDEIIMTGVSMYPPYNPMTYKTVVVIKNAGQNKSRGA